MSLLNFSAEGIDITNRYEALPAGDYLVMVTESDMRRTKDGAGQYLELKLEVQAGPMQGRNLWDRLNIENPNPKAVEIAQRQLAQICHALGIVRLTDSQMLHNRPLVAMVKVRSDDRGLSNEVKGYKPAPGAGQAAAQLPAPAAPRAPMVSAPPQTMQAAQPAAPAMPWATARV
jgi:hypothetical protein